MFEGPATTAEAKAGKASNCETVNIFLVKHKGLERKRLACILAN